MAKTFRYQHLRTATSGAVPTPSVIREGELAVNIAKDGEKIFLKNTNQEIVKFITEAQIDAKIQSQSGTTDGKIQALSGAIDTLDDKVDGVSGAASTAIGAEETRATGIEAGLRADVNTVSGDLATEITARGNADTTLQNNIDAEATTRAAKDKAIIDSFVYDSTNKKIKLSDGTNNAEIDCTDFIKDGMIDNVKTQTSAGTTYLIITWNTDAGKEQTILDIGDIFEADNYYTKAEIDDYSADTKSAIDEKLAISDFNSYSSTTKTAIDSKLATTDFETYSGATKTAIDSKLASADFNTYSAATESAINSKLATNDFNTYSGNTKDAIDSKLATNDFEAYSGATDTLIGTKLATSAFETYSGAVDTVINSKAAQSDLDTLSGTVTAHTADTDIHITSSERTTWNAKQEALVSGTNIKTVAGKTVLGSGNVEIGIADIKTNDVADFTISGDTIILDAGYFTEFI